jgi:drug/metabolite transporter (DMT)-like permease
MLKRTEGEPTGAFGGLWDQPYVLLVATMIFWAGNTVLARAMADHIPPVAFAQMRWTLALLILLPFTWRKVREDWPEIRHHAGIITLLGLLGISAYNTLVYVGVATTTAINAMLLSSIFPMVIAAVGFGLYRDRLTVAQFVGILVACVGAAVILSGGDIAHLAAFRFAPGDLWVLAAQLAYAGYTVLLRARPKIHPLSFLTATVFMGQLLLVPLTVAEAAAGSHVIWDRETILSVLYVTIFAAVLAFLCFNRAVQLVGSNRTGPFFHLIPVFGSVAAMVFLGERLGPHHVAGWVLIILGIAVAQVRPGLLRRRP